MVVLGLLLGRVSGRGRLACGGGGRGEERGTPCRDMKFKYGFWGGIGGLRLKGNVVLVGER